MKSPKRRQSGNGLQNASPKAGKAVRTLGIWWMVTPRHPTGLLRDWVETLSPLGDCNMPNLNQISSIARFPICPNCGAFEIRPAFDGPICFRENGKSAVEIPRSQAAAYVRFVSQAPGLVLNRHLYRALGDSDQYSRTVDTIWDRYGSLIHSKHFAKQNEPGVFAAYSIGEGFRVWEPQADGGGNDE